MRFYTPHTAHTSRHSVYITAHNKIMCLLNTNICNIYDFELYGAAIPKFTSY